MTERGDANLTFKSAEELKVEIAAELGKEPIDTLKVAGLANALADLETAFVRFTVDASHVERLGYELVGKQGTALAELVKNAYDADATVVTVDIDDTEGDGGIIRIEDDGLGMNLDDIRRAWMRISTSNKVENPLSSRYKRRRAGKKGIGRFAVQRLGRALTLTTGQRGYNSGWQLDVDWDNKHVKGKDITLVPHEIRPVPKNPETEGTVLEIRGLRDRWSTSSTESAWRSVSLLQAPLRDQKPPPPKNSDPGFQAFMDLKKSGRKVAGYDVESEFSKSAVATISGTIDAKGDAHFEVHSATLNLHDTFKFEARNYKEVGPVRLETDYFIYATEFFSGLKINTAQKIAAEIGGVRLYRNGFRVAPYVDPNNDWLGFATDVARRHILVPANNNNFLGRVYITSAENPGLEETASREGLIENSAYESLVDFIRQCIYWAIKRVGWARDKKTKANEPGKQIKGALAEQISVLLDRIDDAASDKDANEARRDILSFVRRYEDEVQRAQAESIRYEAMLRVLASLGLSISVFAHEVRAASSFADDSTKLFLLRAREIEEIMADSILKPLIDNIESGVEKITVLGDYLGGLTAYAGTRKLATTSLIGAIRGFHERIADYLSGQGVAMELDLKDAPLRTAPIHRSEIDSILFNLTTNALKAVKKARPEAGKVRLSAYRDRKFVVLVVSDNGTGIDPSIQEKIFEAFFTTTGADNDDPAAGAGLGLKIVADIASNYGGSVRVVEPSPDMKTAIEFRVLGYDENIHEL